MGLEPSFRDGNQEELVVKEILNEFRVMGGEGLGVDMTGS